MGHTPYKNPHLVEISTLNGEHSLCRYVEMQLSFYQEEEYPVITIVATNAPHFLTGTITISFGGDWFVGMVKRWFRRVKRWLSLR
jgi:hypothetical protein